MSKWIHNATWVLLSILGAFSLAGIAINRGEPVNSIWLVAASACTCAVGFRFYATFVGRRVMALDNTRATPAERLRNGYDFEPTNKWILLGHHFAAIAGAGPLLGPVLAAQYGYLPGTLWIIVGAALGGAVQDFVILFASMRRDGKSLGQMAREEIGKVGGFTALLTVFLIMVILLAAAALVVVNALKGSPWGAFTILATMPIALFMGIYMRYWRPGKVLECSVIGFGLVMLAIFGGQWVSHSPSMAPWFTYSAPILAVAIIVYGFLASALPVWLLVAPRGYLSTFVKLGVILILGIGILLVRPHLQLPALTRFTDGTGPVLAGRVFPFCFITIACGAISGFHSLISSGTTPKMIAREWHAMPVGYGAMCLESFVAIMAMISACVLQPGVYFTVNSAAGIIGTTPEIATATVSSWGFPVTVNEMKRLAQSVGENNLFFRTGGAPSLALGMAHIFAKWGGGETILGFWYHFAIMFEALFILTLIDTGTRVGRYMLQDLLGHVWKPLKQTSWMPGAVLTSALVVLSWGYFLYQGVLDPLGGIHSLWPLFGIANQLLAAIALSVAATIIVKTHRARYFWVTGIPLLWLLTVTFTAAFQKIFSSNPRIGFLSYASQLDKALHAGAIHPQVLAETRGLILNARMDAIICGLFILLVITILVDSLRVWSRILRGTQETSITETPFVLSQLNSEEL